jgi:16S rRNA (cytosine967-C5)-methyltransferase
MSLGRAQLDAIINALTVVLPARAPADTQLRQFFRDNKSLGQKDRALVADTVYAALRRRRLLEQVTPRATPREIALATLVKLQGVGLGQIESQLRAGEKEWLAALKAQDLDALPLGVRADLPDWVIERLRKQMSEEEVLALAKSLQQPAPLDLRVNSMKAPRQGVLDRLEHDQIAAHPTRHSPLGVRLREKPALNQHPMFLDGAVEVQDEGSQILGMLVEARRGEMVVDFCAGAGGKTLQMGAAMGSTGRLYAFDVSDKRLANLAPRLKRSGTVQRFSAAHRGGERREGETAARQDRSRARRCAVHRARNAPAQSGSQVQADRRQRRGAECQARRDPRGRRLAREARRAPRVRHLQPAHRGKRGCRQQGSSPRTPISAS